MSPPHVGSTEILLEDQQSPGRRIKSYVSQLRNADDGSKVYGSWDLPSMSGADLPSMSGRDANEKNTRKSNDTNTGVDSNENRNMIDTNGTSDNTGSIRGAGSTDFNVQTLEPASLQQSLDSITPYKTLAELNEQWSKLEAAQQLAQQLAQQQYTQERGAQQQKQERYADQSTSTGNVDKDVGDFDNDNNNVEPTKNMEPTVSPAAKNMAASALTPASLQLPKVRQGEAVPTTVTATTSRGFMMQKAAQSEDGEMEYM
jgi:hypothetical protein